MAYLLKYYISSLFLMFLLYRLSYSSVLFLVLLFCCYDFCRDLVDVSVLVLSFWVVG